MALMSCADERNLIKTQNGLAQIMLAYNRKGFFEILGPAPAMVSKINGMYRWKILVKSGLVAEDILLKFIFYCIDKLKTLCNLDGINMSLTLNPRILA
jgi:primosomal protein N'